MRTIDFTIVKAEFSDKEEVPKDLNPFIEFECVGLMENSKKVKCEENIADWKLETVSLRTKEDKVIINIWNGEKHVDAFLGDYTLELSELKENNKVSRTIPIMKKGVKLASLEFEVEISNDLAAQHVMATQKYPSESVEGHTTTLPSTYTTDTDLNKMPAYQNQVPNVAAPVGYIQEVDGKQYPAPTNATYLAEGDNEVKGKALSPPEDLSHHRHNMNKAPAINTPAEMQK